MEVDSTKFWAALPAVMGALIDSRWVAIDVEMTGIATNSGSIPPDSTPQAAYQSIKEAAELYQILQIGFTFCKYNNIISEYETKTIEFPISPLFPPEEGARELTRTLDRKFTTSVLSYAFLRDHNLSLSKMLDSGVSYLSKDEELDVKRRDIQRFGNNRIDISRLHGPNMKTYTFYNNIIRHAVESARSRESICVQVPSPNERPLNGYEMKLIYQMLQDDFPFLVARGTAATGRFNVVWANPTETVVQFRHGIRYVFDALTGEEFASKIKQNWIPAGTHSYRIDGNRSGFGLCPNMGQAQSFLKARSPIIVGHNLFHDLAFIYRTFFGNLPETLDEFLATIHELFPRIIDTKYMSFRGEEHQGQAFRNMSLSQLYLMYEGKQFPFIRSTDGSIEAGRHSHHAGYDSALTMTVFLKQAVYIQSVWCQSRWVSERVYRRRAVAVTSHPRRESILDEQEEWEKASRGGLNRYTPLQPYKAPDLLPRLGPAPQDLRPRRLENYSMKEATIMPPWGHAFWREFGNKTRIGNVGVMEFK
ncbi:CAF1-domain-containing protein [Xylaria telfairii]|nr:CAF1-domain-containing protein [Xylaria telfairii]